MESDIVPDVDQVAMFIEVHSPFLVASLKVRRMLRSEAQNLSFADLVLRHDSDDLESAILQALRTKGVIFGVDLDSIDGICNSIREGARKIDAPVAFARFPVPTTVGRLRFAPRIRVLAPYFSDKATQGDAPMANSVAIPSLSSSGQIDHRAVRSFITVTENELIAVATPGVPGIEGEDVLGQPISIPSTPNVQPKPGANVYERNERLYAKATGKFSFNEHEFWVETKLVIAGDIDYRYGNIRFPGDLVLKGAVKDEFKVSITGNLTALSTLDVFQVLVGGDVKVEQGIIGRGTRTLRSKGSISAKYIENCSVDCLRLVQATKAIYMSEVHCRGTVIVSHGRIIGGLVNARDLIDVQELGNSAEIATEIVLGVDFVTERLLSSCRKKLEQIMQEKKNLSKAFQEGTIGRSELEKRISNLNKDEDLTNDQMVELMPKLDVNDTAVLRVRGIAHPGTHIRICSLRLAVVQEMKSVEFYINKSSGSIVHRRFMQKSA